MADRASLFSIAGWAISIAITVYLIRDVSFDLGQSPWVVQANAGLGIPAKLVLPIGIMGLICTLAYALPQTAMLGAILLRACLENRKRAIFKPVPSRSPGPTTHRVP